MIAPRKLLPPHMSAAAEEDEDEEEYENPLNAFEYEDARFNGFNPKQFMPPLDPNGGPITRLTVFKEETIIRVPVKVKLFERQLSGILGEEEW